MNDDGALTALCVGFVAGGLLGWLVGSVSGSHEQGVRDALAGKYVVVQLPDGSSVVVENKEGASK